MELGPTSLIGDKMKIDGLSQELLIRFANMVVAHADFESTDDVCLRGMVIGFLHGIEPQTGDIDQQEAIVDLEVLAERILIAFENNDESLMDLDTFVREVA